MNWLSVGAGSVPENPPSAMTEVLVVSSRAAADDELLMAADHVVLVVLSIESSCGLSRLWPPIPPRPNPPRPPAGPAAGVPAGPTVGDPPVCGCPIVATAYAPVPPSAAIKPTIRATVEIRRLLDRK